MAASKKSRKWINVVVVLAVIGGWTMVDNTYRLGKAVVHTVSTFHFAPAIFVQAK